MGVIVDFHVLTVFCSLYFRHNLVGTQNIKTEQCFSSSTICSIASTCDWFLMTTKIFIISCFHGNFDP